MKRIAFLFSLMPLFASERMLDPALTAAQRNNACRELTGAKSPEVIQAMREALADPKLRACAGNSLRASESFDVLKDALRDERPEVRAIAIRELAASQKPEFIAVLAPLTRDSNLLVAANAVRAIASYDCPAASQVLYDLAKDGGMAGTLALNHLAETHDPRSIEIARKLMTSTDIGDILAGVRIAGAMGSASDLPTLRKIASKDTQEMAVNGRGFGLMPSISLSRAALTAIREIVSRQ